MITLDKEKLRDRFWAFIENVSFHTDEDCWNWTAGKDRNGYGEMHARDAITNKRWHLRAHRVSMFLYRGFDLNNLNLLVCHRCDNPACINPHHLFIGSPKDNTLDMLNKGRDCIVGSKNNGSVISEHCAKEIRNLYSQGGISQRDLARKFKLTAGHINNIIKRRVWRHI